jgi:hypothetical protein
VFNSGFSEGRFRKSARLSTSEEAGSRRLVKITDDFHLFHALLFYLYTDQICFSTDPDCSGLVDIPTISDAEGMYALSHRLLFDSVTSKAQQFLQTTCTIQNITAREFGSFAQLYAPIGAIYHDFFMRDWDNVVKTKEFEQFFAELEEGSADYVRVHTKLRGMIRDRA